MKKIMYFVAAVAAVAAISSCGASRQTQVQAQTLPTSTAPFNEAYEVPCMVYDTDEVFAATGIYRGSSYQKGECILNALANARQQVYEKFHHSYKGMVSNYSSTIGNNRGNDIATKLQRAGDQILDVILNDIQACCTKFSGVQDDGMIECYVAIKVPKNVVSAMTVEAVKDVLTNDEKDAIKFDEYQYRKMMEEYMAKYNEQKK